MIISERLLKILVGLLKLGLDFPDAEALLGR